MNRKTYIYIYKVMTSFMIVTVMLCLSACSEDDEVISQNIIFTRPVLTGITRANVLGCEMTNPYDKSETFRVFGSRYHATTNPKEIFAQEKEYGVEGEEAIYNNVSDTWDTQRQHLWQNNTNYAFRAYSPSDIQGAYYNDDATGLKIKDYITPDTENQYDLLYAPAVYDRRKYISADMTDAEKYSKVNLVFMHALSTVHFKVRIDPRYIKEFPIEQRASVALRYTIRRITLSGVYNKASFDEKACVGKDDHGRTVSIPCSDIETMWYGHDFDSQQENSYDLLDGTAPIYGICYKGVPDDIIKQSDGAHVGFMIPQKIPEDAEIRVEWSLKRTDGEKDYVSVFRLKDAGDTQKKEWKPGCRYVYTLAVWDFRMDIEPAVESIIDDSEIKI